MTIGEHLLQVVAAGLALSEVQIIEERDAFLFLDVLMDIEDTLDLGRICVGVADSGNEHIREINAGMDELRRQIALRIEQCDKNQFEEFMEQKARRSQSRFKNVAKVNTNK
jgi:hypothetical protein